MFLKSEIDIIKEHFMEHFYYVYKITCLMNEWNGMFYIGKHFGKVDDNYTGSGRLIREYFAKYGKVKDVTYIKEIIDYGTEDNICDLEREYIREGMASELCLNMICHSSNQCKETRRKLGESHKGKKRKPFSEEHRKHMSESLKGRFVWNKGKHLSNETRRKISESQKLRTGEKASMYGKKHSDETRRKISESLKKRCEKRRNNG